MAFVTLGRRGGQCHLFWERETTVSLYNHSSLIETNVAERWATHAKGTPHQTHTLMAWINTAIRTTWMKVGELWDILSKWYIHAELTQVMRELGMKQSMFNRNTRGPDDQRFTGGM